ncbi:MAG: glucose-6-phosphate isomerase family protein [Candidatus Azambacteria bacterium]|nr:glucose-6-phosphate isomerase family protein [Candidatus Azambacteria bacterium]
MELKFDGDFAPMKKFERGLDELRPFLSAKGGSQPKADQPLAGAKSSGGKNPDPVYRVWRGVCLKNEKEKIKNSGLRLDLTLIPPGKINDEFVKTAGHYHLPYPEMYFVLYGRAYILTQSYDKNPKAIKDVRLTEAGAGEQVFIPLGFGHNAINVFNEPLVFATLIDENAVDDYESYKNTHGASYYFLDNGNLVDIVKNPNYVVVTELKKIPADKFTKLGW